MHHSYYAVGQRLSWWHIDVDSVKGGTLALVGTEAINCPCMAISYVQSSQSVGFPTDRQDLNCIVASFVDSAYSLSMMVKFLRRCCEQNHSKVLTSLRACARTQAQTCVGWYAAAQGALGYRLMSVPLCDSHSGPVCLLKATGLSNFVITSENGALSLW